MEVQVVYDASRPQGRRAARPSAVRVGRSPRAGRRTLVAIGSISLLLSGGMYYAVWWQLDPFIYLTLMLKSPVVKPMEEMPGDADLDLEAVGEHIFRISPESERGTHAEPGEPRPTEEPRWGGHTAVAVISASAYSWLTLATVGYCALALAGGTAISTGGGRALRGLGLLLALGVAGGMAYGGYRVWGQYHLGYQPWHLRTAMGLLAFFLCALGVAVQRGSRVWARLAAGSLILAALGSAVGLYLWHQAGAIEARYVTPWFLAVVFVVHSLWGWALVPFSSRL